MLPAQLQVGMGPSIFPPTDYFTHLDIESTWWRWAELLWLLCPTSFFVRPWEPGYAPYISAKGCPAIIAANACDRISAIDDGRQLIEEVRTSLASFNPWFSTEDRRTTLLAVNAAYTDPDQPGVVPKPFAAVQIPTSEFDLTARQEVLLIEMFSLGAIGSDKRVKQHIIVAKANPKDDPDNYKKDFASLREMGLTQGTTGRNGGVWLTAKGKLIAGDLSS